MICKKYSAQFKIMMIEEFLRKNKNNQNYQLQSLQRIMVYQIQLKYKRQGIGFCNITEEIKKLELIKVIDSTPIQNDIIKEKNDENESLAINRVRMKYNGVIIEFIKKISIHFYHKV